VYISKKFKRSNYFFPPGAHDLNYQKESSTSIFITQISNKEKVDE